MITELQLICNQMIAAINVLRVKRLSGVANLEQSECNHAAKLTHPRGGGTQPEAPLQHDNASQLLGGLTHD